MYREMDMGSHGAADAGAGIFGAVLSVGILLALYGLFEGAVWAVHSVGSLILSLF